MIDKNLGTKRLCPACHTKFYDLNRSPARCPKCGEEFVPKPILPSKQDQVEAAGQARIEEVPAAEAVAKDVVEVGEEVAEVAATAENVAEVALEEAEDTPVPPDEGPFLEDDEPVVEEIIATPVKDNDEEG